MAGRFEKYQALYLGIIILLAFVGLFASFEYYLFSIGDVPGRTIDNPHIIEVDSLYLIDDDLKNDQDGIMRFSEKKIKQSDHYATFSDKADFFNEDIEYSYGYSGNLFSVMDSLKQNLLGHSEYSNFIQSLIKKDSLNEIEKETLRMINDPLNSDGFRGIELKNYSSSAIKILMLGDSFLWGMMAKPMTESFSDLLAARGYVVFNTGIPATDPAQYLAIAKKYTQIVRPDIVLVNFYFGNDVMYFEREVANDKPIFYNTNAGIIYSNPLSKFLKMEQSYDVHLNYDRIPQNSYLNRIFSKSRVLSRLWRLLYKYGYIDANFDEFMSIKFETDTLITQQYLEEIEEVADNYNAKTIFSMIPFYHETALSHTNPESEFQIKLNKYFPDLNVDYPIEINSDDYVFPDAHFNNVGHKKYADYLEAIIENRLNSVMEH